MYEVSSAYLAKLKSVGKKTRRIRGSIGSVSFTELDILENSFSYTDIAVKSSDIKLGGVFIGSLKLTFLQSFVSRIPRGSWRGRVISNLSIGLYLGLDENDEEIWEDVPLKPYTIDEANHSALGLDIVAYDDMRKFDATIQLSTTSGNLYGIASLACDSCGVTLGMTAQEMAALPNGNVILGLYPDNDIETWRDLISWIATTVGGFATINRDGELEFRIWKEEEDIAIGVNDRFTGGNWSDFSTNYTAVQLTDAETGEPMYYAIEQDTGLTMDLGANPLLQYGVKSAREAECRAILEALQKLKYVPFSSSSLIDPALDLGDVILYSDGIANDALSCVMRIDFSFSKGATVKGYGKNPSLNGARSAQDKAISQASKGSKEQGLTYYTYINTTAVTLTETPQRLYRLAFATAEQTNVDLWFEPKWLNTLAGDTQTITYEYYLDGVKFDREVQDTFGEDGYHTTPHPFWLQDVTGGETHYWEVKASVDSGTAVVSIGDMIALLKGQRLVGDVAFDGNIEMYDEYEPLIGGQDIIGLSDSVISIERDHPYPNISKADTFTAYIGGQEIIGLSDDFSITREKEQFYLVTEDGDNLATEDGDTLIT